MVKMISEGIEVMQSYAEELLLLGMAVLLVCAVIQLHRIKKMNRKLESIVQSVEEYLAAVMGDEEPADAVHRETRGTGSEVSKYESRQREEQVQQVTQEEQSRLVSAVLQEIFP